MTQKKEFYEFAEFRLDLTNKVLSRGNDDENVSITRKMFETLLVLVESSPSLVEKEELMQRILKYDLGNEDIMGIHFTADGEKFAFIRGSWQHDAFLINGLK